MKAFYLNKFWTSHSTATSRQPLICARSRQTTRKRIYWYFEIVVNKIITTENAATAWRARLQKGMYNRLQTWSGQIQVEFMWRRWNEWMAMDGGEKCSETRTAFWFGSETENKFFTVHVGGGSANRWSIVSIKMGKNSRLISIFTTNLFSLNTKSRNESGLGQRLATSRMPSVCPSNETQ